MKINFKVEQILYRPRNGFYKMRLACEAIIKALYNSNKYQIEVLPPQLEAVQNILELYKQQADENK
jgi:hypothetical protein